MNRALRAALALFFVLATTGADATWDLETRLHAARSEGRLDRDQVDLYRLYAVRAPERLPPEFQPRSTRDPQALRTGEQPISVSLRCGTPILRATRARLSDMRPEVRAEAELLLASARPSTARAGGRSLARLAVTAHFSLQWGSLITDEDGSAPARDDDRDAIPDVVELWADLFEASYREIVEHQGFGHPALDGVRIPVYIGNSDSDDRTDDIGAATYAFTQPGDPVPHIVVNNDLSFVPLNDEGRAADGDPFSNILGAMKITAAHEMFHVIHFLYETRGVWKEYADDWWLETSSVWMEDEVFDGVNDYYQYFRGPGWASFAESGLPVDFGALNRVTKAYGGVIFAKYLAEHVGGRASMFDVWDFIRRPPGQRVLPALEEYSRARGFSGLGQLFLGFAAANAVMDYEEGAHYGRVPIRKAGDLDHEESVAARVPDYLGATYLLADGPAAGGGLQVALTGDPATTWGLALLVDRIDGRMLAFGEADPRGNPSLHIRGLTDEDNVFAVPVFLNPDGDSYEYATSATAAPIADTQAPGPVADLSAVSAASGFDLVWIPAQDDSDVSGYVLRWKIIGQGSFSGTRTLFGPITSAEIRGLAAGPHVVEIFAYDSASNEGPRTTAIATADEPPNPAIPRVSLLDRQLSPSAATGEAGSGGGGGGCFLRLLGGGSPPFGS